MRTCPICSGTVTPHPQGLPGRPRTYCSPLCRQRAFRQRLQTLAKADPARWHAYQQWRYRRWQARQREVAHT